MSKVNVSLRLAIDIIAAEKFDECLLYDEQESYYASLSKKYGVWHLKRIVALELALVCMKNVLKRKSMKELV